MTDNFCPKCGEHFAVHDNGCPSLEDGLPVVEMQFDRTLVVLDPGEGLDTHICTLLIVGDTWDNGPGEAARDLRFFEQFESWQKPTAVEYVSWLIKNGYAVQIASPFMTLHYDGEMTAADHVERQHFLMDYHGRGLA